MKRIFGENVNFNIVPVLTILIAIWILLLIPFKIIGYGFLPPDDALRHSAKAVSGKDWSEILVLRNDIKSIEHHGWAAILGSIHKITGWDAHSLVLFSVISLSILFLVTPLFFLRYPESWLLALLTIAISIPIWFFRIFLGRPFILAMAILMAWCFLWPKLKEKESAFKTAVILTILIAAFTWVYSQWYLFIIPLLVLLFAREWRSALVMSYCLITGVIIGAVCTGHPFLSITEPVRNIILYFLHGQADVNCMLAIESRSGFFNFNLFVIVVAMLIWRTLRKKWDNKVIDNPVFILGVGCLFLGCVVRRFSMDWGTPVIMVWLAQEFEDFFKTNISRFSLKRVIIITIASIGVYFTITTDTDNRWSTFKPVDYLSAENAEQAMWLPSPGGILYSDDMNVFYQTFFKNPKAQWRYMLGFESILMPPEDLAIFRNIQRNSYTYKPIAAWVKKMRPEDRLILRGWSGSKPDIPELEWHYAAQGTWSGRLPRNAVTPSKN